MNYLGRELRENNPVRTLMIATTKDNRISPEDLKEFRDLFPDNRSIYMEVPFSHGLGNHIYHSDPKTDKFHPDEIRMFQAIEDFFLKTDEFFARNWRKEIKH